MNFGEKNDRYVFLFFTHRRVEDLCSFKSNAEGIPEAEYDVKVPGLEVYRDFITEQ